MEKQLLNLKSFLEDSGYQIVTTIQDDTLSDKNTLNVYLSNKLSETAEELGHEDPYETHHTKLEVEFNDTGKIKTYNEDLIVQDRDFFNKVSELAKTSPEAILDTVRERAEWSFNNFIRSDFQDFSMEQWNELFDGRKDGLEVFCEETGETYLKEVDSTSIHFTVSVQQPDKHLELEYNVGDNESHFKKEYFLQQHGDTLKESFNQEQIDYILSQVNNTINDRLFFITPRMTNEEHELATEYFGITGIEVDKVKTVKNDEGGYNCITTVNYQDEKYILNLQAEKGTGNESSVYFVDMSSLDTDSKDNTAFKNKVIEGYGADIVSKNFNFEDIELGLKEGIEKGIIEAKMGEKKQAVNKNLGM
ncbi:hypothetical protein [Halomonas hibernica]|uniref:hypothetical protein n=1 Tax=Halomonas hibernica TaxID=2591147 RepID=UPI0015516773|nr:hypothetical protein [Halomonas hibernica]